MKKLSLVLISVICTILLVGSLVSAGTWSTYSRSGQPNLAYRGLKGDFKLPSIYSSWGYDPIRQTWHNHNFITFEEWITVNAAPDWFEVGYMNGAIDPTNSGTAENYTGFYRAKSINGVYSESKLSKTATVGTRYTFSIVDVNVQNLWEVYIGSTYFGSFSDRVSAYNGDYNYQGYEFNIEPGSPTPTISSTDITAQKYYTSGKVWNTWSTGAVNTYNNNSFGVSSSYNSSTNTTTITK